mmetsp:Transcript_23212/g.34619  ORF Transcript_23212/g.34619 Transcript_23212/m.34619 type:complete len:250 (-) Transcript_23212:55-804(-)
MFKKSIFQHMKDRKWDKVRDKLAQLLDEKDAAKSQPSLTRPKSLRNLDRQLSGTDFMGQNALLRCMNEYPPLDVVESIIKYSPQLVEEADFMGQTALHFAVMNDDVKIVERIIELHPYAAHAVDAHDRTPLHVAVQGQSSIEIVATLCLSAPSRILSIDSKCQSPIDAAKAVKASESVICLLEMVHKTFIEKYESIDAALDQLDEDVTQEGVTKYVDDSFGWTKGKATQFFCLDRNRTQKRRVSLAKAA